MAVDQEGRAVGGVEPPGHKLGSFKPVKSRSLVLKKGKTTDKFRFALGSTQIPSITEKPVKRLGKVFDCSFRDSINQSHQLEAGSLATGGGQVRTTR